MPTYEKASKEVNEYVERVMDKFHQHLRDMGVTVDVIMASPSTNDNGDVTAPAVTLGGYSCAAKIKVTKLTDRVMGRGDAEMMIDLDNWEMLDDEERDALIDHELYHVQLKTKSVKGGPDIAQRDDIGRPSLKLRKHDHQFGWFDAIAERHGASSYEVKQARQFQDRCGQTYLFDADAVVNR